MLSCELPTEGTEVILEGLRSTGTSLCAKDLNGREAAEAKDRRQRRSCRICKKQRFKAAWRGATFEAGIGWAVVAAHTPLTEEEAAYAESGYLSSLRGPSELEEFDFSMPAGQPAAWTVLVPDGVTAPQPKRLASDTTPSGLSLATEESHGFNRTLH